jgi:hypothetical protein
MIAWAWVLNNWRYVALAAGFLAVLAALGMIYHYGVKNGASDVFIREQNNLIGDVSEANRRARAVRDCTGSGRVWDRYTHECKGSVSDLPR